MTLTQLFTAIANAIRAKKGTSGTITASNFPTEIASITTGVDTTDANAVANDIVTGKTAYVNNVKLTGTYTGIVPTGTKSITQNGTVDVSNYANANVNVPTPTPSLQSKTVTITENGTTTITPDTGYDGLDEVEVTTNVSGGTSEYNAKVVTTPISTSYTSYPNAMRFIKEFPVIDLTGFTTCQSFFSNCYYLEKVELFDTSNSTNMSNMFQRCYKLTSIPQFNSSKVTNMQYMFEGDGLLETIPILDTHLVAPYYMVNMYSGCSSLSNESLNNILYMIAHCGSGSAYRNLAYIGLSQSQATTCTGLSNWASAQSAGWSTGY